MSYESIKAELNEPNFGADRMFAVLKGTAKLVNNPATLDLGRDLVIRLLSKGAHLCGDFERQVLISLVRTVGLFPYMKEQLSIAADDDLLAYEFHYMKELDVVFHGLQARIYNLLQSGSNVVLSAATSAGKSLLIDAMIASNKFRKVVIILPTLALIDETRRRLTGRFLGRYQIITQPSQQALNGSKSVYVLTQERARKRDDLDDVDFFVIDEFYKLDIRKGDDDARRAIELNLCFHKLASKGAQFYLLGPNIHAIQGLDRHEVHFIPSGFSTVAVDIAHHDTSSSKPERLDKLLEILSVRTGPTLIYCQSANSAASVAEHLILNRVVDPPVAAIPMADWLSENFHFDWIVTKAVRAGIGVHHGSLPRSVQQIMVRLFNEGVVKILICTSTLIEGVNTAAETVVIFDRRKRRLFDFFTYKNIQGRAGRMGRYFVGKVHVLERPPQEEPFVVEYEVGRQSDQTPMELILQLPEQDLTPDSAERIKDELGRSLLNEDTIRANASVSVEIQNDIAREIAYQLSQGSELYRWSGLRCSHPQLSAVCNLIVGHVRGPRGLADYRVFSGAQLALKLRNLEYDGFKAFLDDFAREEYPDRVVIGNRYFPRGEPRCIPEGSVVHESAFLKRAQDSSYKPENLGDRSLYTAEPMPIYPT